ncbi:MAG: AbrB family transcriptional regulator [Roseovarius sp.]|nr:AbrB family transcriptional regulator [Roseovarius sp.]
MRMAHFWTTILVLAFSALTGYFAQWIYLPLPYLLGPMIFSGLLATSFRGILPRNYQFPLYLRMIFIAVIGLMIGTGVTSDLLETAIQLAPSFILLTIFVPLVFAVNYVVSRRIGRFDKQTALYSSSPGGLYESIAFGEVAGANVARLSLQQFLRVTIVVTLLPIGMSIWLGHPVGSAQGMTLAKDEVPWQQLPLIALSGVTGMVFGKLLRFPAWQLTGPIAAAAIFSISGILPLNIPQWLVNVAQVVVGASLGMRFSGLTRLQLIRGFGLSAASVGIMLVIASICAILIERMTGETFDVLLISYAPGGVTEMAIIALSLNASPTIVTMHHVWRILVTVLLLSFLTKVNSKKF